LSLDEFYHCRHRRQLQNKNNCKITSEKIKQKKNKAIVKINVKKLKYQKMHNFYISVRYYKYNFF